jgi:stage II sporulation protein D
MKKLLLITLLFTFVNTLSAMDILVRIYADQTIRNAHLSCVLGQYRVKDETGKEIAILNRDDSISLRAEHRGIKVLRGREELGTFQKVTIMGDGLRTMFRISPDARNIQSRIYDDHLEISVENNALRFVNIVNLENYVAGVVQSEVLGSSDDVDFFKIQAIISRTYAMTNFRKHRREGFHLCDGVHCQAYYSRNNTPRILQATAETAGMVLIDNETGRTILASFHANSGGQTMNSEDVWVTKVSYLRSVLDTFSLNMRGSTWQKEYTVNQWLNLLHRHYKYDIHDQTKRANALNFVQNERKTHFHENIRLRDMRRDLDLRSTFFNVRQDGDKVILEGRGYGHGVGLSQEGAVRKIREGFSVEDVLKFYYKNVGLVKIDDLFDGVEQQF